MQATPTSELMLLTVPQNGVMSRTDAMRCFVKCGSSALQMSVAAGSCPGRLMMMNELAADLNDRSLLEESHYAYTAIRSAYHQAFATPVKQGTAAY